MMTMKATTSTRSSRILETPPNATGRYEGPTSQINRVQHAVIESLTETGCLVRGREIFPDTDLAEVLTSGGLDSPSLLVFKSVLERRLSLVAPIPVTALTRASTVRALEAEILKASIASSRELLLPFATEGTKTPLFLFPPGGGEMYCWIELVRHLPDRPIYGLRLRGLQPGETAFDSMNEVVSCFIHEIRQKQPRGPYFLLGMCFGGNIAYEVGKAFEAEGEVVAFAGGIDNAPHITQMSFSALRFFIIDLLATRQLITPVEATSLKSELEEVDPIEFPHVVMRRFRTRLQTAGITRERLEAWNRVFRGTAHMATGYAPKGRIATYTSFWALPLKEWGIDPQEWQTRTREWENFAHRANFHFIPGDHYTALTKEHILDFVTVLKGELDLRGG